MKTSQTRARTSREVLLRAHIYRTRKGYTLTLQHREGIITVLDSQSGAPKCWLHLDRVIAFLTQTFGFKTSIQLTFADQ